MKKFLISAAALMAGTAALAQTAPVAPVAPQAPMARPMADKVMTRNEMVAMVRDHFARMDTNKDGSVTTAEVGELRGKAADGAKRRHFDHRVDGAKRDPNAAFDRLDANKDGTISRDEFAKGHEQRIERRVEIREKRKDGAKDGEAREFRMHRMGGMGGSRMIALADTNQDGRTTLAEAEALALQHFDQMDSNRDGQVTSEERRAARPAMHKRMQAPSAG